MGNAQPDGSSRGGDSPLASVQTGFDSRATRTHVPDPAAQLPADERWPSVPGYEILGVLGRGGMGVVYQARQVALKRLVALKMIRRGSQAGPDERARFTSEAEAIARLQHPNIVQIHEVGEVEGHPFYALEFVAGGSLAGQLAGALLPPRDAAQLLELLAQAMHAAHCAGVIHRDLKPANVLLSAGGAPKVTDFGLAKQMDDPAGPTQTGQILGTPSYMAPEQASGQLHQIGPATDVYALGAVLYECLTGRPPFKGATMLETLEQVRSDEPVGPSRLQPRTPRDLETICLKCLHKEPARRYATAQALAADLQRFLKQEPIHARPLGRLARLARWCRRKPAAATATALTILLLGAVVAVSVGFAIYQTQVVSDLQAEERKTSDALHKARVQAATLALEQGLTQCEQGDAARGLLWLARSLQLAPEDETALRLAIRTNLGAWRPHVHPLRAILAHSKGITSVVFSPDGKTIATGSFDHRARLWDTASGQTLGSAMRHDGYITSIRFSPDGKTVLTASEDRTARLWDAATGLPIRSFKGHTDWLSVAAFSLPDGRWIVTGSGDGTARIWDAGTGSQVGVPLKPHPVFMAVAFNPKPSNPTFATVDDALGARLWELPSGKLLHKFASAAGARSVAFSPDGKRLVTGDAHDVMARLWEVDTGQPGPVLMHQGQVAAVAFSADGRTVLTGSLDQTARLWNATTGRPIGPPLVHQGAVLHAAFSPDQQSVVTGSAEGTARFWDPATGRQRGAVLHHQGSLGDLAFSPDGRWLLTGSWDGKARLWEAPGQDRTCTIFPCGGNGLVDAVLSPDGRTLLAGGFQAPGASLWDVATAQPIGPPLPLNKTVRAVALSPDSRLALTGGDDKQVRRWEARTGKLIGAPLEHQVSVSALAFSPDGKLFLSGTSEWPSRGEAILRETATGQAVGPPLTSSVPVAAVAFHPRGDTLVIAGGNLVRGEALLRQTATGKAIGKPLTHQADIHTVVFSPDGNTLLTASSDKTARLWDAATGEPLTAPLVHQGSVWAIAFSPDGRTILTGSEDQTARLWDAATGQALGSPLQHPGMVRAVAFHADGRTLLTGCSDGAARLWDLQTRKPLGPPMRHDDIVVRALFSPDGRSVLTASHDGTARLWPLPTPAADDAARHMLWLQGATGLELHADGGIVGLELRDWQQARRRLEELGGLP